MNRFRDVLLLVALSAALTGCAIQRWFIPSHTLTLDDVQSITIEDTWWGLSPVAPLQTIYNLTEENGAWVGSAHFSVAGSDQFTQEESISIPADVVLKFRQTLETAPLYKGEYTPLIEHTDDYPSIRLTFQTASGSIAVYSESQGDDHVPWGAQMNGTKYTIDSNIPAQAYALLMPYLKNDVLTALVQKALDSAYPSTSTPVPPT